MRARRPASTHGWNLRRGDIISGWWIAHLQSAAGRLSTGVNEIIEVTRRGGGLTVLAHLGRSKGVYAIPASAAMSSALAQAGLDWIEVFYSVHYFLI